MTQTGQPGPAMTSTFSGSRLRKPKWLMVHSCVPQTWHILTERVGASFLIWSVTRLVRAGSLKLAEGVCMVRSSF
jgi:hypothetical protein